ncbi:MAG: rhomboid family intramembrane serine protease [Dehalococcoidia bacterium]|nr:rhomboid family intramembrane serine protease [Dehalococcoidia bacterium]
MIPVGDSPVARSTPWVVYLVIVANFALFIWTLSLSPKVPASRAEARAEFNEQTASLCYGLETMPTERERFYCRFALQPQEFVDNARGELQFPVESRGEIWLSLLTSMFMHAGWLHILGNMLFLWVFGDNVEDRLGHLGFLLFYLASGAVAAMTQVAIDTNSVAPIVGASGAVAGVLGAYLVFFPKATVNVVFPIFILILIPIPIPAVVMIGAWFFQNLFAGILSVTDEAAVGGGVAFFAHIGGFLFGALLVLFFLRNVGRRRPAPRWVRHG